MMDQCEPYQLGVVIELQVPDQKKSELLSFIVFSSQRCIRHESIHRIIKTKKAHIIDTIYLYTVYIYDRFGYSNHLPSWLKTILHNHTYHKI